MSTKVQERFPCNGLSSRQIFRISLLYEKFNERKREREAPMIGDCAMSWKCEVYFAIRKSAFASITSLSAMHRKSERKMVRESNDAVNESHTYVLYIHRIE